MSEETQIVDYGDLELATEKVKVGGKVYTLTEATESEAKSYRNFMIGKARMKKGETVGYGAIGDAQSYLLSKLLRNLEGHLVNQTEINSWPSRIVSPLFDRAKDISGLNDGENKDDDEELGNS